MNESLTNPVPISAMPSLVEELYALLDQPQHGLSAEAHGHYEIAMSLLRQAEVTFNLAGIKQASAIARGDHMP